MSVIAPFVRGAFLAVAIGVPRQALADTKDPHPLVTISNNVVKGVAEKIALGGAATYFGGQAVLAYKAYDFSVTFAKTAVDRQIDLEDANLQSQRNGTVVIVDKDAATAALRSRTTFDGPYRFLAYATSNNFAYASAHAGFTWAISKVVGHVLDRFLTVRFNSAAYNGVFRYIAWRYMDVRADVGRKYYDKFVRDFADKILDEIASEAGGNEPAEWMSQQWKDAMAALQVAIPGGSDNVRLIETRMIEPALPAFVAAQPVAAQHLLRTSEAVQLPASRTPSDPVTRTIYNEDRDERIISTAASSNESPLPAPESDEPATLTSDLDRPSIMLPCGYKCESDQVGAGNANHPTAADEMTGKSFDGDATGLWGNQENNDR
jgi:hypothetical protein